MTKQELRVVLSTDWFCGCGNPEEAATCLLKLLRLFPLFDNRPAFEALIPDYGLQHLVLYSLDGHGLIEHGGCIVGSWLTDKGTAVRAALEAEEADRFETLMAESCLHGFAVESDELLDCPSCGPANKA